MGFLPSGLYGHTTATAALYAAATEQEQQRQIVPAFSPVESSLKQRAMVTAFAPTEKKIELYSRVGNQIIAALRTL